MSLTIKEKGNKNGTEFICETYRDLPEHPEGGGIEDKISVVEISRRQVQSKHEPLFSKFHHPTFGHKHFAF